MLVVRSIALLLVALLTGCMRQSIQVPDATKPATLTLSIGRLQKKDQVHGLDFRIHGQVDGVAFLSSSTIITQRVSGSFDIKFNGDYFSTNCVIEYSPQGVRSGSVSVSYAFRSGF